MEVEDDLPLPSLSEGSELMDPFHIQQVSITELTIMLYIPSSSVAIQKVAVSSYWS